MYLKINLFILIFSLILLGGFGCIPKYAKEALCIENHSGTEMFFWYSKEYPNYHYPDTMLPSVIPIIDGHASEIRGAGFGGCVESTVGRRPNWVEVYSELPAGLFTVYFFKTRATTQAEWDSLRNNPSKVMRKDVTLEFLRNNEFTITYP